MTWTEDKEFKDWEEMERAACVRHGIPIPPRSSKQWKKELKTKIDGLFIKGPYPVKWQAKAASISPSALVIGNALWLMTGITNNKTVHLSKDILALFHISRSTYYRCLVVMENQGLVSVSRAKGNALRITILS